MSAPAPAKTPTTPQDVLRRIGDSNEQALAYVLDPDPQLGRLGRKVKEALITDLPPVTAGALLGPAALARHFVASAASGRYRDLFALWELFKQRPEDCKPVLAERPQALEKARAALATAVRLGINGRAQRVVEDVNAASGLIWTWVRDAVVADLAAVGGRPAITAALLAREPDLDIPLPAEPDDRWLTEAAALRQQDELHPAMEALLAANVARLPATVGTLALADAHYQQAVGPLLERVDLDDPALGGILAWARDHGRVDALHGRVVDQVGAAADRGRADGLAAWWTWRERGVAVDLPAALRTPDLDGLDLTRPEAAYLVARLRADGAAIDVQATIDELAAGNRQLGEKAYEAFVCADLDVALPASLEANPIVREGTRCPWCQAWTWVRPGHERRCPRRPADADAAAGAAAPEPVTEPAALAPVDADEQALTAAPAAPGAAPAPPVDVADAWTQALEQDKATPAADPRPAPDPAGPPPIRADPSPADPSPGTDSAPRDGSEEATPPA